MIRRVHPIILIIILLLAAIGFVDRLASDPVNTLLVIGLTALVVWLVRNFLRFGKFLPPRLQAKGKPPGKPARMSNAKKSGPASRKSYPFQVIEGKKGKEKNTSDQNEPKMYH